MTEVDLFYKWAIKQLGGRLYCHLKPDQRCAPKISSKECFKCFYKQEVNGEADGQGGFNK